jgi:hypothetical protein
MKITTIISSLLMTIMVAVTIIPTPRLYYPASNTVDTNMSISVPDHATVSLAVKRETMCEKFCAVNPWMCKYCKKGEYTWERGIRGESRET